MASSEFPLAPFSSSLLYMAAILPAFATVLVFWQGYSKQSTLLYIGAIVPLVLTVFLVWLGSAIHGCSVAVTPDKVTLKAPLYGRDVARKSLKVDQAKMVATDAGDFRPGKRENGVGLSELKLGWFKLGNGEKALVLVSDPKRAIYIPTTEGFSLLVSPQDADGFLGALKT